MPLTCKGRVRGVDASRGDIDDALGNFSLTLVDTLDSLAVLGKVDEFVEAVQLVVANVKVRRAATRSSHLFSSPIFSSSLLSSHSCVSSSASLARLHDFCSVFFSLPFFLCDFCAR